jgi:hypothetical protein
MKLKTVDVNGTSYAVLGDGGAPLYVDGDREFTVDGAAILAKLKAREGDLKGFKERAEVAEERLKAFEGIDDPETARTAIETVRNLKDGELVSAGKVDEIKAAARKSAEESVAAERRKYEKQLSETAAERDKYKVRLHNETVGNAFARSKFVSDKIAVPTDLVQAMFAKHFSVDDDGRLVATDGNGEKIVSRSNHVDPADFEEAIEHLVSDYPHRDAILKGAGNSGSGARPSGPGNSNSQLMKLSPVDRINAARSGK